MSDKRFFFRKQFKGSLASRQLVYILLFSSLVTLISASFQIYMEYRADIGLVDSHMEQVENVHLPGLTNSLWHLDDKQIQIQLESILSIDGVEYLEMREKGEPIFSAGFIQPTTPSIVRVFPLVFKEIKQTEEIGTLLVTTSLESVYQRLYKRVAVIITSQAIKTFLVSFFILFIIYRLVTRHLISLAEQTEKFDLAKSDSQFFLDRNGQFDEENDELDQLVSAFNRMRNRMIQDVSQQQLAQKKIQKLEQQFRHTQKMESVGTMAGGIAHHFNNILGIILGNAELVQQDIGEDNSSANSIRDIQTAGFRAKEMITQLLNFSQQSHMEKKSISIIPVVKESISLLKSSIPSSIKIESDIHNHTETILANPMLIEQVLINLGMNAAHAMPEGGTLIIEVRIIDEDRTSQIDLPSGRYVVLIFSDTGHGIAAENMDRIFDPYFTTKGVGQGTGMGLAVVHGIVHDIGGLVSVKSVKGKGSQFSVHLPVLQPV